MWPMDTWGLHWSVVTEKDDKDRVCSNFALKNYETCTMKPLFNVSLIT